MRTCARVLAVCLLLTGVGHAQSTQPAVEEEVHTHVPHTPTGHATPLPEIAVVGNYLANASTAHDNDARNRMDIGLIQLELRAQLERRAEAVVILPFFREVHDPLFPDGEAETEVESGVEIEEAFVQLHDFGVPNLKAKLGRFHLNFGKQNLLHGHDWPTADNNFVNQSFLGPEALSDAGASLIYGTPFHVDLIAEIVSGEGGGEEAPVLNNDASVGSPALNLHAIWHHEIASTWDLELGGSFLTGRHFDDDEKTHAANLYGFDATLVREDPSGGYRNVLIQLECIYGDVRVSDDATSNAFGAYLLAQRQFNRAWYGGVRLDWTENAVDDSLEAWGVSPYVTWYLNENLRFRLQYQHRTGDVPTENNLFFQATFVFGKHGPHTHERAHEDHPH